MDNFSHPLYSQMKGITKGVDLPKLLGQIATGIMMAFVTRWAIQKIDDFVKERK